MKHLAFDPNRSGRNVAGPAALHPRREFTSLATQESHSLARVIAAQEAESRCLARELHDVVSQKLAVINMELFSLASDAETPIALKRGLEALDKQLGGLSGEIHQISRRAYPAILDDLGLVEAIRCECAILLDRHGIATNFTASRVPERLPGDIGLCLYRAAQEGLRNVRKHAETASVRVTLTAGEREISLSIEDTGSGFDMKARNGRRGLGLVSMEARARLVHGAFTCCSRPGRGTRIEIRVPLERQNV